MKFFAINKEQSRVRLNSCRYFAPRERIWKFQITNWIQSARFPFNKVFNKSGHRCPQTISWGSCVRWFWLQFGFPQAILPFESESNFGISEWDHCIVSYQAHSRNHCSSPLRWRRETKPALHLWQSLHQSRQSVVRTSPNFLLKEEGAVHGLAMQAWIVHFVFKDD